MAKKKLLMSVGILLAISFGFALAYHHGLKTRSHADQFATATQVHGELIQAAASSEPGAIVETTTNGLPKRKHPKPPSVQRRMVLAQLAEAGDPNAGGDSMPAGTVGTAADLAKTNLPSASSLPAIRRPFPGCTEINFGVLSGFDIGLDNEIAGDKADPAQTVAKVKEQIPQGVQALNGKKVVIQGYLLPVKMDDGLAVEFLLMRNQSMCCYGVPPKITEWITVKMKDKGVKAVMDQPIAVAGTLHVGPALENGYLTGIYGMDGDKAMGPF